MSHEALYRKYRPKTFSELMGQDAINRTLTNALGTRQVAHAYLFCGPRGTGKTSTARLLAKTLNCEAGGTEPCNRCASCLEITSGNSLDVIEIDAASNRGIDDIRALREQVRFAAVGGRYKVYIIDECHQLSADAVNALLKTLEEPPENVVFVMATTEAHKVLPTIVSRCQRFDFQRIPTPVLLARLQEVATAEQIPISGESLRAIARRAAGGLRDALTLLDQVASLSIDGMPVSDDLVFQVLGEVRSESLLAMGDAMLQGDVVGLWEQASAYLKAGYDPQTLLRELMQHLRNLLIVQVAADRALDLEVPESLIAPLTEQAAHWTQADLIYCLELLNETAERVRRATHDQIWLEAGLARVCQRQAIASVLDLQARVEALEKRAGMAAGDRPAPVRSAPPSRPAAPPRPSAPAAASVAAAAPAAVSTPVAPQASVVQAAEPPALAVPSPAPVVSQPAAVVASPAVEEQAPEPEPTRAEPPRDLVMPPPVAAATLPDSPAVLWSRLVEAITERHPPTAAILKEGHLVGVDLAAGTATIGFKQAILKEQMEKNPKRVALIEGGIKAIFGAPLRMKCVEQAPPPPPPPEPEPEPVGPEPVWMDEPDPLVGAYLSPELDMEPVAAMPQTSVAVAPPPVAPAPAAPIEPEDPFQAALASPRPAPKPAAPSSGAADNGNGDLVAEAVRIFKGKIFSTP